VVVGQISDCLRPLPTTSRRRQFVDRAASAAKAEIVFLALLQGFEEQGRSVSPNPSNSYAPVVFEREADADGVSKAALGRANRRVDLGLRVRPRTACPCPSAGGWKGGLRKSDGLSAALFQLVFDRKLPRTGRLCRPSG
jgi:hypothetical protein